ncbi:hypothetical protein [Ornithinimicrobium cavernae]|uniref:hypothetical protein n=1 Tax=Ornithinimicrobium cavernae TaxID=2666047 RepID=UPI0012B17227|nr:hypothetical protein [Ornithinimicrobium cavernae]
MAEGPGREDRHDDADDIDARFEEIVAGLRAEQAASANRRREAIRRAQEQRDRRPPNRPLEGFDSPNPWPPRPAGRAGDESPSEESARGPAPGEPPTGDQAPGRSEPGRGARRSEPGRDAPDASGSSGPDRTGDMPPAAPRPDERAHRLPPAPREPAYRSEPASGPEPTSPPPPEGAAESWRGWEESGEEEHFIPPTPSLPAGDLHLWAIVLGLLGGPILLILSEVFHVLRGEWWTPLGIFLSVAGVVLLFLRLPKNRDYTDSSGGAQV